MTFYVATSNPAKLRELRRLLGARVELLAPPSQFLAPEESEDTYAGNALLKARALARLTGRAALADDSGLEVEALGGRPGIHSARYGSDDAARIARLLAELAGRRGEDRRARFRAALAVVFPDGRELTAEGGCEGTIGEAPVGAGGFGYDPVFVVSGTGRTFAEMTDEEKDELSHRGRAVRILADLL